MRRSTLYDEDLSEVVDLSEHGTWANANLCEIIQDLVDALFPLQTMSEGHEERFVLSTCHRYQPHQRFENPVTQGRNQNPRGGSKSLVQPFGMRRAVIAGSSSNLARAHQPLLPSGFFRAG